MLLFRSHNTYYIVSAAASSLIFAFPMLISIALYVKRGGFEPDDDLSNATLHVMPLPPVLRVGGEKVQLPPPIRATPKRVLICVALLIAAVLLMINRGPSPDDVVDYRTPEATAKSLAAQHAAAHTRTHFARVIATTLEGFKSWDAHSPREDGGAPGGFDSVAASYLLRNGLKMQQLLDVFANRVEAATWTVRFFTPSQKEEVFVEVDPRKSQVIGYHKYQAENAPGPRLEEAQALPIARAAFAQYRLDVARFALKEALSFQQPNRRDWLFHFDEQTPIAAQAFRRVSVRVAGSDVTQFTTTVQVPDAVYRDASKQTITNVVLLVLRIIGIIGLLGLVIGGFVVTAARRRPHWSRAFRWTLAMSIIPILSIATAYERNLFGYNTSVKWETFTASIVIDVIRDGAMRIGLLFLAFAAIDAALPYALDLLRRESRAR